MTYPILRYFDFARLPPRLQAVASSFSAPAVEMTALPPGPEVSAGLRHLLEAKDCAVRAALETTAAAPAEG